MVHPALVSSPTEGKFELQHLPQREGGRELKDPHSLPIIQPSSPAEERASTFHSRNTSGVENYAVGRGYQLEVNG